MSILGVYSGYLFLCGHVNLQVLFKIHFFFISSFEGNKCCLLMISSCSNPPKRKKNQKTKKNKKSPKKLSFYLRLLSSTLFYILYVSNPSIYRDTHVRGKLRYALVS
ncbi:hypothetical protein CsSME_00045089 [Camellia sinensis var. sinensis]